MKRAMEFLEEPKVMSEKDLAAQVGCKDLTFAAREWTTGGMCAYCSWMPVQDAKRKAAAKRKRESKPAKASKVAAAEEADDAAEAMGASNVCTVVVGRQQGRL